MSQRIHIGHILTVKRAFNIVHIDDNLSIVDFFYMCECAVGVDVRDGTTIVLSSILSNVVMGCIVLGRQMNVYFGMTGCTNTS